jgi:hypothetical protein
MLASLIQIHRLRQSYWNHGEAPRVTRHLEQAKNNQLPWRRG